MGPLGGFSPSHAVKAKTRVKISARDKNSFFILCSLKHLGGRIDHNFPIGAIDGDGGEAVPPMASAYFAPLLLSAVKGDAHMLRAHISEGQRADTRHTGRDRDTRKAIAMKKGARADTRHAVGNSDACKVGATREGIFANARQLAIFFKGYAHKAQAISEGLLANTFYTIWNGDARNSRLLKGTLADVCQTIREGGVIGTRRCRSVRGGGVR